MIYLNKEETRAVDFNDYRGDVAVKNILRNNAGAINVFLTVEEAWQLMQTLQDKLYLHEEVRIRND